MKNALEYMVGSKLLGGGNDEFDESFDGDLAEFAFEEQKNIQNDRLLAIEVMNKFEEREFCSIADFFSIVKIPDLNYLMWTRHSETDFDKEHHACKKS